jgi:hypothetical protein
VKPLGIKEGNLRIQWKITPYQEVSRENGGSTRNCIIKKDIKGVKNMQAGNTTSNFSRV